MSDGETNGQGAGGYIWAALIICACICMAFFAGAMWQRTHEKVQPFKIALAASEGARDTEQKQAVTTQVAVKKTAEAAARIHHETQKVISYVPYVITPDVVRHFPLSNGFVRVVDASITGDVSSLAASPGEPDDAASPVAANRAALTLTQNFGTCRESLDREIQWQTFAINAGLAPKPKPGAE